MAAFGEGIAPNALESHRVFAGRQFEAAEIMILDLDALSVKIIVLDFISGHIIFRLANVLAVEKYSVDSIILAVGHPQHQATVFFPLDVEFDIENWVIRCR